MVGTLEGLTGITGRKVGLMSSQYVPYVQGCKHATMADTKGRLPARVGQSHKVGLSSN